MRFAAFVTGLLVAALGVSSAGHADADSGESGHGTADADKDLPRVRSEAAAVLDVGTGAAAFAKEANEVRPIASTTKIFVAMAVRRKGIDLDAWTEITRADFSAARGGARTRLDIGQSFQNIDLLRAMLLASDNRAPTALGRAAGLDADGLIAEMNAVAKDLGLKKTKFTDTSGLRGNVSTAREMALALTAALDDEVLAAIMATDRVRIVSKSKYAKLDYVSTNQALHGGKFTITGGKTGYTRAAGYCFIVSAKIDGRHYAMAFLGGDGKGTRFADFDRVAAWIVAGAPGASFDVKAASAAAKQKPRSKSRSTLRVSAKGKVTGTKK